MSDTSVPGIARVRAGLKVGLGTRGIAAALNSGCERHRSLTAAGVPSWAVAEAVYGSEHPPPPPFATSVGIAFEHRLTTDNGTNLRGALGLPEDAIWASFDTGNDDHAIREEQALASRALIDRCNNDSTGRAVAIAQAGLPFGLSGSEHTVVPDLVFRTTTPVWSVCEIKSYIEVAVSDAAIAAALRQAAVGIVALRDHLGDTSAVSATATIILRSAHGGPSIYHLGAEAEIDAVLQLREDLAGTASRLASDQLNLTDQTQLESIEASPTPSCADRCGLVSVCWAQNPDLAIAGSETASPLDETLSAAGMSEADIP